MSLSCLFVGWPGGGNVTPFVALAPPLQGRGSEILAVTPPSLVSRFQAAGIRVPFLSAGSLPGAEDVLVAIEQCRPDVLVVDYMLTSALSAAEARQIPTVALVHTLYNALLVDGAPFPMAMASPVDAVNATRQQLGLDPISGYADLLARSELALVTAPAALDTNHPVPPNVRYVGPLVEPPGADEGWQPPAGDGPLVAACVGTASSEDEELPVLEKVVDALGQLPVRGLVNVADYVDRTRLNEAPNVTIAGYVRHAVVLPHAALLVTHAGLGSINAALAFGVRMVCLPIGREQPQNAAAVARMDAGAVVPAAASVDDITAAIDQQLAAGRLDPVPADPGAAADLIMSCAR